MLRALSTRRSQGRYERLVDDQPAAAGGLLEGKLQRARSLPAKVVSLWTPESFFPSNNNNSPAKLSRKAIKSHPLFNLFYGRRGRKKATAKPEFSRYLEYVKEGGMWDPNSNMPVMYYK